MAHTEITTTVRRYPRLPYDAIKDAILGEGYHLSLVMIGEARARRLNEENRNKSYVPNVLSFPLDRTHGEIFITPARAAVEAKRYSLTPRAYVGYLFIHGCLHLKGHTHGATMERAEQRWLETFILRSSKRAARA